MSRTKQYQLVSLFVCLLAVLMVATTHARGPVELNEATSDQVIETFPERAVGGVDLQEYRQSQAQLHSWLISELPAGTLDAPVAVSVTAEDLSDLERRDAEDPSITVVGLTKDVSRLVDLTGIKRRKLSGTPTSVSGGRLAATEDGGFVWATALASEGASAVRLHFRNLDLPSMADLFIYNLEGQAFGPYRNTKLEDMGDLWSHSLFGPNAVIQLRVYGPLSPEDRDKLRFTIADLGHIGSKFLPAAAAPARPALTSLAGTDAIFDLATADSSVHPSVASFCSQNEPCIENASCGGPSWGAKNDAQDATALMLWISGPYINTCTGGLIADTDPSSQIPYFLTANHCLSKSNVARNLETYFQFTVGCGGSCPSEWAGGGIQRVGSSLKKSSRTGDYTLLELDQAPPSGSAFMGWTTANVANSNGTPLFRISHPSTAPQAYSTHSVDTSAGTCQGVPRGNWIYSSDTHGATEGGSSGSPVYNSSGQVVGQLTGACGFNPGDPCDSSNSTTDGAFAGYYSNIASFLDPSPCNPSPEVCDNGSDDDCDGNTDCDDSDCSGDPACQSGGCNLGQPGDSCSSNSDCCSNKCKGPPSNRTCR